MKIILELSHNLTGNYGISIILLSIVVNTVLLPLYYLAQKWKAKDQALQALMKDEIKNIKKYYKGQERHFYIQAIYRRYGYHPLSSVKASLGFLIQIPFFFAAFHLLSNYAPLNGVGFWFLKDLGKPDLLLNGVNLLPIVMTVVNLLSAYVYGELLSRAEKIQLWSLAFIFLLALYTEASGLLLYWTMNNVYSLFKNLTEKKLKLGPLFSQKLKGKLKKPQVHLRVIDFLKDIQPYFNISLWLFLVIAYVGFDKFSFYSHNKESAVGIVSIYEAMGIFIFLNIVLVLDYIVNENKKNWTFKIIVWSFTIAFFLFSLDLVSGVFQFTWIFYLRENIMTVLMAFFAVLSINKIFKKVKFLGIFEPSFDLFILLYLSLLFLVFIVNPTILYNSAADDFSLSSGVLLVRMFLVFLSGLGITIVLYFISDKIFKNMLIFLGSFLLFSSLLYSFVIVKNYGLLDHFIFNTPEALFVPKAQMFLEIIGLIVFIYVASLALLRRPQIFKKIYMAIFLMLVSFFLLNLPSSSKKTVRQEKTQKTFHLEDEEKTMLSFSKEKNILVIFLDGFSGDDMQTIVDEKNYIFEDYTGFVWYKNTLSTGTSTWSSIAAMFGGHNYTVENINSRINKGSKKNLREELDEAYDVFPTAFIPQNWQVSYFNPQYAKNIDKHVYNSSFDYGKYYLSEHRHSLLRGLQNKIEFEMLNIISIFRSSPLFMKETIYSNGTWSGRYTVLSKEADNIYFKAKYWGFLNLLTNFSNFNNPQKTLKYVQLAIPHGPHAVAPDGTFSPSKSSYRIEAYKSLEKIGELIHKLKEQDIYDNTKIILVSDHGWFGSADANLSILLEGKIAGFGNRMIARMIHPLMLVKDFNAEGNFKISNRFMSNADVPSIVCSTLENHCNIADLDPTKHDLQRKLIISSTSADFDKSKKYSINKQYEVSKSIFDPSNWKKLK